MILRMSPSPRYALYWAPDAAHPLWHAGCAWLGRDPETGATVRDLPDTRCRHVETCRRYGFHATLKAPFALADGCTVADLDAALARLAGTLARFPMPALAVSTLADFIALRPREHPALDASHPLRRLADACVRGLDPLRAPSVTQNAPGEDRQERAYRARWGYPYVLERWRFHLSLADPLPADATGRGLRDRLVAEATSHFADALATPLSCDAIALFVEERPGADFRLARRVPFGREPRDPATAAT
jgi:hypothetical protein